jgi:tetratricopeptide (TPR) repeat protein
VLKPNYAEAYYNLGIAFKEAGVSLEAIINYNRAFLIAPNNSSYYANYGHKEWDFKKPSLVNDTEIEKVISSGNWNDSEYILREVCNKNLRNIVSYVEEFIYLWCDAGISEISKGNLDKVVPILSSLYPLSARNSHFEYFIKVLFDTFNIEEVVKNTDLLETFIIRLSYCEYQSTENNVSFSESLATSSISELLPIVQDPETMEFGWMAIKRNFAIFKNQSIARESLGNFIKGLVG